MSTGLSFEPRPAGGTFVGCARRALGLVEVAFAGLDCRAVEDGFGARGVLLTWEVPGKNGQRRLKQGT